MFMLKLFVKCFTFFDRDLLASDSEGEDVSDILGSTKKSTETKSTLEIRQEKLK